jgi:hypothetical protein
MADPMRVRPGAPCATVNAVREPVRPLAPDSAPELGAPCLKKPFSHFSHLESMRVRIRWTFHYIRRVHAYKLYHLIRTAVRVR